MGQEEALSVVLGSFYKSAEKKKYFLKNQKATICQAYHKSYFKLLRLYKTLFI